MTLFTGAGFNRVYRHIVITETFLLLTHKPVQRDQIIDGIAHGIV